MRTLSEIMQPWKVLNWPNRITLLRLLLVAPFVTLVQRQHAHPAYRYVAVGIFVLLAISDYLDGYLARRLDCKTRLGAILDPLADKLLIICAAILLSMPGSCVVDGSEPIQLPNWVVVAIVGKELWVIAGFLVLFLVTGKVRVRPSRTGKSSTTAQLVMVSALLLAPDFNRLGFSFGTHFAQVLWWAVFVLSLGAIVSYTRMGLSFLAEEEVPNPPNHQGNPG
ncbi:MAG TPA: CDP-alcohol phosphatidyltransferase family protein [Phycisphaerae bacterium]|nr:CDP-alcohol phosphatidyltransferase family protein [Phycisphaerae bacterium]